MSLSTTFQLFIGGGNHHQPAITDKLYHIMLYWVQLAWLGFKLTTLVVIGTDCIIKGIINPTTIRSRPRWPQHQITCNILFHMNYQNAWSKCILQSCMVFHDLIIYCNVLPYFHLWESMKMFGIQRHIFFNTIPYPELL